jgi:hypothetical protein
VPPLPGVAANVMSRAAEGRAIVAGHLARRTHKRH